MNAEQEAIYSTYQPLEQHLDDNSTIIAANPEFVDSFALVKTKIGTLTQKAQQADLSPVGLAVGKNNAKQSVAEKVVDVAGIVSAFADKTNNEELRAEVRCTLSALLKMKADSLILRARNIHALAEEYKDPLTDYGITVAILTDLQTAIDQFAAAIPKPRTARSTGKTLTADIAQLFKDITKLFENQLDKMIVAFKAAHPEFVQTYFNLREVPDPPSTPTQLKGVVTDFDNNAPIKDAEVTIVELGKTARTNASGNYQFKPIILGKYTVRVTKAGYQNFEESDVQVKLGEIRHFDVKLKIA